MLYPLKFKPILKQTIWGGDRLAGKATAGCPTDSIGESWEISGVQDNISVVSGGPLEENSLEELTEVYMGDLVGDKVYEKFGIEFPLLIKYIDARADLSIQVHPDDETARERHNAYGKTEMWYLADAAPEAELIVGFSRDSSKEEYMARLQDRSFAEILNKEKVSKGDCFFIPAGTVHAICKGCFIAEIQQTSDITYRIYDYDRRDRNGNPRELHTELAADVIRYSRQQEHSVTCSREPDKTEELVSCSYFTTNHLRFDREIEKDYINLDSFVIYMCLDGNFRIRYDKDHETVVNKGETVLLPACFKDVFLLPDKEAELLEIYIK